jgi:hypothetical protein
LWVVLIGVAVLAAAGAGLFSSNRITRAAEVSPQVLGTRETIVRALGQLGAEDQVTRDLGRSALLSLRRLDLPTLRDVLRQRMPLAPTESESLHEIVAHVYLSEESYPSDETVGFVGVIFDPDQKGADDDTGGVEIRRRLPGFCGYRYLEDGDVILGVGKTPAQVRELRSYEDMTEQIKQYPAGQRVLFRLLRRGKVMNVSAVLSARPTLVGLEMPVIDFQAQRGAQAEGYWEQTFEPLLEATAQVGP